MKINQQIYLDLATGNMFAMLKDGLYSVNAVRDNREIADVLPPNSERRIFLGEVVDVRWRVACIYNEPEHRAARHFTLMNISH